MKYKLTDNTIQHNGKTLYQIQALKDIILYNIKKGELGGYVESEDNLSQEDFCWIADDAKVYDNAKVSEHALIYNNAQIYQNAQIVGTVEISGNAQVYGNAYCNQGLIYGDAKIFDEARVYNINRMYGRAVVCGKTGVNQNKLVIYGDICFNYEYKGLIINHLYKTKGHPNSHYDPKKITMANKGYFTNNNVKYTKINGISTWFYWLREPFNGLKLKVFYNGFYFEIDNFNFRTNEVIEVITDYVKNEYETKYKISKTDQDLLEGLL